MCTILRGTWASISVGTGEKYRNCEEPFSIDCPLPLLFAGADNVIFERLAPGQEDLRQTTLDHLDVSNFKEAT